MSPPATGPPEPGYVIARNVLAPYVAGLHRFHVVGRERIPQSGPVIVAVNHISLFDPLGVGWIIDRTGRRPRFFGKSSLFDTPVVGHVLRSARQIRVDRGTASAPASLEHAEKGISEGELIVIFPEGTTSKAPDLAPRTPKTGVARLALATGASVIPCATWGGQWAWSYHMGFRPGLRKDIWITFGEPISFDEYAGREDDPGAWDAISKQIMEEIAGLLEPIKALKPWTPRPLTRRATRRLSKKGQLPNQP